MPTHYTIIDKETHEPVSFTPGASECLLTTDKEELDIIIEQDGMHDEWETAPVIVAKV
jgi:hypothetical protein